MEKEKIIPEYLGKLQCLNVEKQCYYGQSDVKALLQDKAKQTRFEQACASRKGRQIQCCHPDLINVTYESQPYEVPFMVQNVSGNRYNSCPENVKAGCFRQPKKQQALCIQNACLDNGYRLASNYYEICKALDITNTDLKLEIPDCPTTSCWGDQIDMLFDYNNELLPATSSDNTKPQNNNSNIVVVENDDTIIKYYKKLNANFDAKILCLCCILIILVIVMLMLAYS